MVTSDVSIWVKNSRVWWWTTNKQAIDKNASGNRTHRGIPWQAPREKCSGLLTNNNNVLCKRFRKSSQFITSLILIMLVFLQYRYLFFLLLRKCDVHSLKEIRLQYCNSHIMYISDSLNFYQYFSIYLFPPVVDDCRFAKTILHSLGKFYS